MCHFPCNPLACDFGYLEAHIQSQDENEHLVSFLCKQVPIYSIQEYTAQQKPRSTLHCFQSSSLHGSYFFQYSGVKSDNVPHSVYPFHPA